MVTTSKKVLKIVRSAARLPIRVSSSLGTGKNSFLPIPGEIPVTILRVQALSCQDLESKDRSGFCDP
jgi:phosphatidylserine decarboxylase